MKTLILSAHLNTIFIKIKKQNQIESQQTRKKMYEYYIC